MNASLPRNHFKSTEEEYETTGGTGAEVVTKDA